MATYPDFPELSRAPALKQRDTTLDPTLRDSYENGMESTRARYLRRRREFAVSIDFLTQADRDLLDIFVEKTAVYGANIWLITDTRNKKQPAVRHVRFTTLPSFNDAGWIEEEYRFNCTFTVREV